MSHQPIDSKRLLSYAIAEWACALKYEELSPEAIQAAKLFWFDSIGCALGGSQQEDAQILLEHYRAMAGGPARGSKATAFVSGFKTNPVDAAFLNAHMIRAQVKWWPGNVEVGGTHIHHLVWGIVLMLVAGFISLMPIDSPWREIMAALFGVGAGLTLDEFALWLRLEDVYWAEEGRQSIDAVVIAATFGGLVLLVGSAAIQYAVPPPQAVSLLQVCPPLVLLATLRLELGT